MASPRKFDSITTPYVEEVYFLPVSSVWQILANNSAPIFEGDQREATELDSSGYELLGGKGIPT
jgi:hypothetical protein